MKKLNKFVSLAILLSVLIAACGSSNAENSQSANQDGGETANAQNATQNEVDENQASEITQEDQSDAGSTTNYDEYNIITLLPQDAIPAIDNPEFLTPEEADTEYAPTELILGVAINGDARAYSTSYLSSREIVNDTVRGRPISVTW